MRGWWVVVFLVACGSSAPRYESESRGVEPPPPQAEVAVEEPEPEAEPPPEPVTEEPPPEPPAEPPPEPFTAANAEELTEILRTASTDVVALRRLIDPERGLGTVGPGDQGMRQWCDLEELTTQPSAEFLIGIEHQVRCDRRLRRCTVEERGAGGYAFHLRSPEGSDQIVLDAIVHYDRRVPNVESRAVRSFLAAGEGVCALRRSLVDARTTPPERLSVLVTSHTGLVPETLAEHHCGDAAAQAWAERVAPHAQAGAPQRCDRDPTRCSWRTRDEELVVYANDEGPFAATLTRHSMTPELDRAQTREVTSFLRDAQRHGCEAGE